MKSAASRPITEERDAPTPPHQRPDQARVGAARRIADRLHDWWGSPGSIDTVACLVFAAFAFWLMRGLWADPFTRAIGDNANDQALIEWFLGLGVLAWQGDFSFVTDRLNSPDGVNLMSNASHILHAVIMAPVTATLGAPVSFALLVTLNLAATAAGWYLLMARTLHLRRGAALAGAAFTGFAPGMIAQSHSHLHMTAQWLIPVFAYATIRLTRVTSTRAAIVTGAGVGVLVLAQVLLGEEVLFLGVLTIALFSLVYAACRWGWARTVALRFLLGAGVAAAVGGVLAAYPLWVQFRGPQHTPNAPFNPASFYADVASYPIFSPLSLAGSAEAGRLATSSAEYNTFLGLPLLVVVLGLIVWRWRSPVTVGIAVTAVIMTLLSFGPTVTINQVPTDLPSLYRHLENIPVVNGALPTRYALALIPLIGVLVAYGMDAAARSTGFARLAVPVAVITAMAPLLPRPLEVTSRQPVPTFITSGAWRQCAPDGGVIAPVPLPTPQQPDLMRWPAAANDAFGIPEGFFIGPYGPGGRSSIGRYPSSTSQLLAEAARTGVVPQVTDVTRDQARKDLAFWQADCVALAHGPNEAALHTTLAALLGPGVQIEDTWTWKVT